VLQYYRDEHGRWPMLHHSHRFSRHAVRLMVKALARRFHLPLCGVRLVFVRGGGNCASVDFIQTDLGDTSWATIAHEFAHTYMFRKIRPWAKGMRCHGKLHRELVDKFCSYLLRQGWDKARVK